MRTPALSLSVIAASLLAGCVNDPVTPVASTQPVVVAPASGAVVTSPGTGVTTPPAVVTTAPPAVVAGTPAVVLPQQPVVAYRPGTGRVASINRVPDASHHEGSASPVRRIGIAMDDGSSQW